MRATLHTAFFLISALLLTGVCSSQAQPAFKLVHSFGGPGDGIAPSSGVVFDSQGNLYGMTSVGGTYGYGTVYELSPQPDGNWAETILHSFPNPNSTQDGSEPSGGVAIDAAGNLFGTTELGGANGDGTIFELSPSSGGWSETILYNFCSLPACTDGFAPIAAPVLDPAGNLYGGTSSGVGQGIVYELSSGPNGWSETILYTFCSLPDCADGKLPSEIVRNSAGNLYGTTQEGGREDDGVVFGLSPPKPPGTTWREGTLHNFRGRHDGADPSAVSLHGNALYGTTLKGGGGPQGCEGGCGTVFEVSPNPDGGQPLETVLHAFTNFSEGVFPLGVVAFDRKGNIYGVTNFGGAACGCGVVFELKSVGDAWQYEILHEFTGDDGVAPSFGPIIDSAGNLYGTTQGGGTAGGVVYEILLPQSSAP